MSDENTTPVVATFDDFMKLDIRVGKVVTASAVPKSKKLIQLSVDFGTLGTRTILAGVAPYYTPETIVGLNVTAVVNLAPRMMMGIESHGMLLAGHNADGAVVLATNPAIDAGVRLG